MGLPRSGTTLLAAMLGAHSQIASGAETLFFPRLAEADQARVLDPKTWPVAGVDFVMSLRLADASVAQLFEQERADVERFLAARSPSVAALLESLTAARAASRGKRRWAEKTPRHILFADRIWEAWPDARLIRIVRDPRDVALSLTRVPFGTADLDVNLFEIARHERLTRRLFTGEDRALTVRFEDLLGEPAATLGRVCEFLGEAFEPEMLARAGAGELVAGHEWWKSGSTGPLDASRAGAWQGELSAEDRKLAALVCRDYLRAFGYAGSREPRRMVAVVTRGELTSRKDADLVLGLARRDAAAADPIVRSPAAIARHRTVLFYGPLRQLGVDLGRGRLQRSASLVRLGLDLAARRMRGRPAGWLRHGSEVTAPETPADLVAAALVQRLGRRIESGQLDRLFGSGAAGGQSR
ncbi:MAG: hypothetical protein QOH61_2131 [Chloroflexota bacterium]|nr:hypothetical protein [Chloroflexota bacterium]